MALNDLETFEGVSSAWEDIAGMMGSCRTYEDLYRSGEHDSAKAVIAQPQGVGCLGRPTLLIGSKRIHPQLYGYMARVCILLELQV